MDITINGAPVTLEQATAALLAGLQAATITRENVIASAKETIAATAPPANVPADVVTLPEFVVDSSLTVPAFVLDGPLDAVAPKGLHHAYNQARFRLAGEPSVLVACGNDKERITNRFLIADHVRLAAIAAEVQAKRAAKVEAKANAKASERTHVWIVQTGKNKGTRKPVTAAEFNRLVTQVGRVPFGCGIEVGPDDTIVPEVNADAPAKRKRASKKVKAVMAAVGCTQERALEIIAGL